jgi:hypothetical protein
MSRYFEESDLDLLEEVLGLHPGLIVVAVAGKQARSYINYPVENRAALHAVLGEAAQQEVDGVTYTSEHIDRFIPDSHFPITSERDLLQKMFLALQRGHIFHHAHDLRRSPSPGRDVSNDTSVLAAPAAGPAILLRNVGQD